MARLHARNHGASINSSYCKSSSLPTVHKDLKATLIQSCPQEIRGRIATRQNSEKLHLNWCPSSHLTRPNRRTTPAAKPIPQIRLHDHLQKERCGETNGHTTPESGGFHPVRRGITPLGSKCPLRNRWRDYLILSSADRTIPGVISSGSITGLESGSGG